MRGTAASTGGGKSQAHSVGSRKSVPKDKRATDRSDEEEAEEVFQGASPGVVYDKYSVNKTIGTENGTGY